MRIYKASYTYNHEGFGVAYMYCSLGCKPITTKIKEDEGSRALVDYIQRYFSENFNGDELISIAYAGQKSREW